MQEMFTKNLEGNKGNKKHIRYRERSHLVCVCECEHACVWGQGISRSCLLFSEPNQLHFAEAAWSEQLGLQAC